MIKEKEYNTLLKLSEDLAEEYTKHIKMFNHVSKFYVSDYEISPALCNFVKYKNQLEKTEEREKMHDLYKQMLGEIAMAINHDVPKDLCTTADAVRWLRDDRRKLERELGEVRAALRAMNEYYKEYEITGVLYKQVEAALKGESK